MALVIVMSETYRVADVVDGHQAARGRRPRQRVAQCNGVSLDPMIVRRLAFIRYLHGLGIDQARLPEPQSHASLLMLHDAVESLLVLAADHYGKAAPKFMDYWKTLKDDVPGGLTSMRGMDRLNRARNDLKHNGVAPSASTIELAVADTATFMVATTQAVFGVEYAEVSMVDVVGQSRVREALRDAETAYAGGDAIQAMINVFVASELLFSPHDPKAYALRGFRPESPFAFGADAGRFFDVNHLVTRLKSFFAPAASRQGTFLHTPAVHRDINDALRDRDAHEAAEMVAVAAEVAFETRRAVRIMALGIEFPAYLRFDRLMPKAADRSSRRRIYRAPKGYAPTEDEFRFCLQFVVTAALRLAAAEAQQTDPEWVVRDQRGRVQWEDIAEGRWDHLVDESEPGPRPPAP
ncbi:hypothetical protein RB614_40535 [Phytohabitans sp. ZYX-F-186]|uniref:Uncharacterized protein n=1 Tax=Phytohabitans maris TaxID=3071409 RepID=A0ABU0ZUT0_9ACTN|nr:hypothetical protein [Phytohabitans sp. ZYX-F-186]MDQ7910798.1 hypothetical protein [Phytohabitans sp. ZYX-F-186]